MKNTKTRPKCGSYDIIRIVKKQEMPDNQKPLEAVSFQGFFL